MRFCFFVLHPQRHHHGKALHRYKIHRSTQVPAFQQGFYHDGRPLAVPMFTVEVDRDDQRPVLALSCWTALDALFAIKSANGAGYDGFKLLGQQLCKVVRSYNGNLQFHVVNDQQANAEQGGEYLRQLCVQHQVQYLRHGHIAVYSSHCEIDSERCKVNPPDLFFDRMPRDISAVCAYVVSKVLSFDQLLTQHYKGCPTGNQAVRDFAYDAWTENCLESV